MTRRAMTWLIILIVGIGVINCYKPGDNGEIWGTLKCKLTTECQSLMDTYLQEKPLRQTSADFLTSILCGFADRKPRSWCYENEQSEACVPLKQCKSIVKTIQEMIQNNASSQKEAAIYIKANSCYDGKDSSSFMIHCPDHISSKIDNNLNQTQAPINDKNENQTQKPRLCVAFSKCMVLENGIDKRANRSEVAKYPPELVCGATNTWEVKVWCSKPYPSNSI